MTNPRICPICLLELENDPVTVLMHLWTHLVLPEAGVQLQLGSRRGEAGGTEGAEGITADSAPIGGPD